MERNKNTWKGEKNAGKLCRKTQLGGADKIYAAEEKIMAHKRYHYYVVARGTTKGIYDDWERCRIQVERYKGNRYKGFYSLKEAVLFAEQAIDMGEQIAVELYGEKSMEYVGNLDHLN